MGDYSILYQIHVYSTRSSPSSNLPVVGGLAHLQIFKLKLIDFLAQLY